MTKTHFLLSLPSTYFAFSSATLNSMLSFLDGYQDTVILTSSSSHPVCRREVYGECTRLLLNRMLIPTMLPTPPFVVCGELSYRQSSLWSQWLTCVIHAIKNSTAILRAANSSETSKFSTIREAEEHLHIVQIERSFYQSMHAVRVWEPCLQWMKNFTHQHCHPPTITPNTRDMQVHYSFDYAQQVHFPSDPLQPGPTYFLTPRKCTVFGVNCEALPRQANFLTDEAGECGKGANNVVSGLHFFETHGLGEKVAMLITVLGKKKYRL